MMRASASAPLEQRFDERARVTAAPRGRMRDDIEKSDEFAFEHGDAAGYRRLRFDEDAPKTCSVRIPPSSIACSCWPAAGTSAASHRHRAIARVEFRETPDAHANEVRSRSHTSTHVGSTRWYPRAASKRVERTGLDDGRQPEDRLESLARIQILAVADLFDRALLRRIQRHDRVRAFGEAAREPQHPAVDQRLLQCRPGIQRGFFDTAAELGLAVRC